MYEVTISVPKTQEHLLAHIKKQTETALAEMDGISTDITDQSRCYFSVACSDTFRFQLKRLLTDSLAETVALGYKNIFVREVLKVAEGTFFQNVLINTMCVFDKMYEQKVIAQALDVDKPVFLDGYCNFRLKALKKKWEEIAGLVSSNNFLLTDEQLIFEFLQYLLDSVVCKVKELTVCLERDGFLLYDDKGNVLPAVESLAEVSTVEEEAALNILLLKPQKVTVCYGQKPTKEFCRLLKLFPCGFLEAN